MASYGTNFDEFVAGAASTNLTGFTVVQATNTTIVLTDLGSGDIVVRNTISGDGVSLVTKDGFSSAGALEVVTKQTLTTTSDQNAQLGPALIDVATGNCYALRANATPTATTWRIARFTNTGTVFESEGAAFSFTEPAAGSPYWLMLGRDGSGNLYASAWITDGTRPGSPLISGVTPATALTTVSPGFTTKDSSDDPIDFWFFGCADGGAAAPESPGTGSTQAPRSAAFLRMMIQAGF